MQCMVWTAAACAPMCAFNTTHPAVVWLVFSGICGTCLAVQECLPFPSALAGAVDVGHCAPMRATLVTVVTTVVRAVTSCGCVCEEGWLCRSQWSDGPYSGCWGGAQQGLTPPYLSVLYCRGLTCMCCWVAVPLFDFG